jgi:hypothetical protein
VTTIEELDANQQNQANMLEALARSLAAQQQAQELAVMEAMVSPGSPLRAGEYPGGAAIGSSGVGTIGSTSVIADGVVTAAKIAVGSLPASRNLLPNGGFRNGYASGWTFVQNGDATAAMLDWQSNTSWTLRDGDADGWNAAAGPYGSSVSIKSSASTAKQPYLVSDYIAITEGESYSMSALIGTHRPTGAWASIWWYDSSGTLLSDAGKVHPSVLTNLGGPTRSGWSYLTIEDAEAPAGAVKAKVVFVLETPYTSGTDCYLFIDQVWFGVGSKALPYQPNEAGGVRNGAGNVVIDSSGITITNGALTFKDAYGSTALNGDGFGPAWVDFINHGLFNSTFQEGPLGAVSAASVPNWAATLTNATASVDADSTFPSGRKITVTPTAVNGSLVLESGLIPVSPGSLLAPLIYSGYVLAGTANALVQLDIQTYAADGTTVLGAWGTVGGHADVGTATTASRKNFSNSVVLFPQERYVRVRLTLKETVGHSASTRLYIGLATLPSIVEPGTNMARVWASDGAVTRYKAGTISDADFLQASQDGQLAIDGTNHRIYFREGGGWHYVNRTAGFQIPVDVDGTDERICPRCDQPMAVGDAVAGVLNGTMTDGALHGVWCHLRCATRGGGQ